MSACLALEQPLRIAYLGPRRHVFARGGRQALRAVRRRASPARRSTRCFARPRAGRPTTRWSRSRTRPRARSAARSISCARRRCRSAARSGCAIRQNLLSNAAAIADVTRVYSHAQSLAQCVQWLARHLPAARAGRRREQRRGGAARGGGAGRGGHRRRNRRGDLRARRPRAAHRGRAQQHDAVLGAGPADRCRRRAATRRRS